ncbi:MAG TPA: hypothetical protein VFZ76_17000 [Anaerolineales bacterium]
MNAATSGSIQLNELFQPDPEITLVDQLVKAVNEDKCNGGRIATVNFYAALKSKPVAILTGPTNSGKLALVQCFARFLIRDASHQCKTMIGHPYWASGSQNVALFTQLQTRFNTEMLLNLIEEAWQPENTDCLFIACLSRISPAEVESYFSRIAFQLGHGELMCLPYAHFSDPIPFPPNLLIVGTMDATQSGWWDGQLLSNTCILPWPEGRAKSNSQPANVAALSNGEGLFLRSSIRTIRKARRKLARILGWRLKGLQPLSQAAVIIEEHTGQFPKPAIDEALIYLSNCWSEQGHGLFDLLTSRNLAIALDLVMAQSLLPRVYKKVHRSVHLRRELKELLDGQFPQSVTFLRVNG